MTERIAIVGLGIRLPGAGPDSEAFWATVATGTDCSRDVPEGRWWLPPNSCLDPRVAIPDTVYSTRGYYLDPFAPDLTGLTIDPALVAKLDPLFHIVLDAGNRAWRSAQIGAVDRSRVGVILGNICLPTERANALCREYLGGKLADRLGLPREPRSTHPLNRYVAGLPAGVLAKALGLGGGSFTLDAACASSLYAIKLAADELLAGRADAMVAGGANGSDCQYTQMGFAQLRALSVSGRCSPFDARADGLMVGEGAAMFVLKRLSDALRHEDTILATIAGVGLSNDMHGNLLAPAKEGQLRAMRRSYERAGWAPTDVDLIECHATGTPVGDAIEFDSLRDLWDESGWEAGRCVIGSVKSTVGHLLTGAGGAAVAKVLKALAAGVLPPQTNFNVPARGLRYADGPFRVLSEAEPWEQRTPRLPRRAAVSGFGFGGVNAHLLLEEWIGELRPTNPAPVLRYTPTRLIIPKPREVNPTTAPASPPLRPRPVPVAVVGIGAQFGPWNDLRTVQDRLLATSPANPAPKQNGWGLADEPCPPGFYIDELNIPIDRFRIPPKELEEALPQQLLVLQVSAAALDDCQSQATAPREGDPNTGVFVGLGLDLNTTNYHLRWAQLGVRGKGSGVSQNSDLKTADPDGSGSSLTPDPLPLTPISSEPLNANRVMGSLGSIAASRIARAFHFGGPSHTVCSEEASAARAVELAVRALRAGEIDRALAGGVELAGDPRMVLPGGPLEGVPGEGAAMLVLKRLADAERDGDRVYAVIAGIGAAGGGELEAPVASVEALDAAVTRAGLEAPLDGAIPFDAAADLGQTGAASAAASLVKACLAVYQEVLPGGQNPEGRWLPPRYWLHDRADGPRRGIVVSTGADGSSLAVILEEYARNALDESATADRLQPLGAREEAVFVVEGAAAGELVDRLARLTALAASRGGRNIEAVAREWFQSAPLARKHAFAVGLVARTMAELAEQTTAATEMLRAAPSQPPPADARPTLRDRVFFAPKPLGPKAKVAFVFPGSGNQFDGMGGDLAGQWPEVLRRQMAENQRLRSQFAPDFFWDGRANDASPRDLMFGQVTVGALVADILVGLRIPCHAMIGLSLGESAGLFGVRAWRSRGEMFQRMQASSLFTSDLAPPYDAARAQWSLPADHAVDWSTGVIAASADDVVASLRPGLLAHLLIVNTPNECVIGGQREDVEKLAIAIGKPFFPLPGVTIAHCDAGRPVEIPYRELHTLPVTPPTGVTVYSGAWGRGYAVTEKAAADSITAGLLNPIDVPAVIRTAYRDGARVFLEVGPGASCTRMIDAILGDKPHLARAAHAPRQDAVSQILRLAANLAAERVPVDLTSLYGRETLCIGHRGPAAPGGPVVVVHVGNPPPIEFVPPESLIAKAPPEVPQEPAAPLIVEDDHRSPSADHQRAGSVSDGPDQRAGSVSDGPDYPQAMEMEQWQVASTGAAEPVAHASGSFAVEPEPVVDASDPLASPNPLEEPAPEPVFAAAPSVVLDDLNIAILDERPTVANPVHFEFLTTTIAATCDVQVAMMQAQETFLRVSQRLTESAAGVLRFQTALLDRWMRTTDGPLLVSPPHGLVGAALRGGPAPQASERVPNPASGTEGEVSVTGSRGRPPWRPGPPGQRASAKSSVRD